MIALVKALLSNCGRVLYETHPPAPPDPKVTDQVIRTDDLEADVAVCRQDFGP